MRGFRDDDMTPLEAPVENDLGLGFVVLFGESSDQWLGEEVGLGRVAEGGAAWCNQRREGHRHDVLALVPLDCRQLREVGVQFNLVDSRTHSRVTQQVQSELHIEIRHPNTARPALVI